jgi:hypothetical protein
LAFSFQGKVLIRSVHRFDRWMMILYNTLNLYHVQHIEDAKKPLKFYDARVAVSRGSQNQQENSSIMFSE